MVELAYARTGSMLKAARVVAFIQAWGVVREQLGRPPTVEEYAEYWGESKSTAYKHQVEFRAVFDRCRTPDPVLDLAERSKASRLDVAAFASVA